MRFTKIICTIGPASESKEMLSKLMDEGMNVARLNFSHGNHEEHVARINSIREVSKSKGKYIGIMLDTKGPEIRTGVFENGGVLFNTGDIVKVLKSPIVGNHDQFHISCPELFLDVKVGDSLLIDDGKMRLTILTTTGEELTCRVENHGMIKSKKSINIPNVKLSMPFLSDKDIDDITFGVSNGVDMIAASFIQSANDVLSIRSMLAEHGFYNVEVISKIESSTGYANLNEILEVSDGIMVARGDLGVDVSFQLVPIYQKKIIAKANELGKPVITATHMLESMMSSPRPTRAEASDVANAVLDGSDAVMLSGETAAGEYPIEAVRTMAQIAESTEEILSHREWLNKAVASSQGTNNDAIGIAVSEAALTLKNVAAIFAFTETGGTAKRISKFRPAAPIIALTNNVETCRKLAYYWGVTAVIVKDIDDMLQYDDITNKVAQQLGIKPGSTVIITSGWKMSHGQTNTMRIVEVAY